MLTDSFFQKTAFIKVINKQIRYDLDTCLGTGQFGVVYKGIFTGEDGVEQLAAVKVISSKNYEKFDDDVKLAAAYESEVNAMEQLTYKGCNNIIKILGNWEDPKQPKSRFIALEYFGDGSVEDLRERYKNLNYQVPEPLVRHIIADMTEALKVLRSNSYEHIYHRDIKPENIMTVMDNSDYIRFVLIDFGLAREIDIDMTIKWTVGETGTRAYIDPAM